MLNSFVLMFFAALGLAGCFVGLCVLAARGWRAAENDVLLSVARFFRRIALIAAGINEACDAAASAWFYRRRQPVGALDIETLIEREFAERETAVVAPVSGRVR